MNVETSVKWKFRLVATSSRFHLPCQSASRLRCSREIYSNPPHHFWTNNQKNYGYRKFPYDEDTSKLCCIGGYTIHYYKDGNSNNQDLNLHEDGVYDPTSLIILNRQVLSIPCKYVCQQHCKDHEQGKGFHKGNGFMNSTLAKDLPVYMFISPRTQTQGSTPVQTARMILDT